MYSIRKATATALLALGMLNAMAQENLSITPTNQNVTATAGTTDFTVSTSIPLAELIIDESGWLTGNLSGSSSPYTLTATYGTNTGAIRTGTITVSDIPTGLTQTVTVTQTAMAQNLSITPDNRDVADEAGTTDFTITTNIPVGDLTVDVTAAEAAEWTEATANAAWPGRRGHTSVVFDNKMWVIGGNDVSRQNDVWSSTDGINWTEATDAAAWSGRNNHTSVVFDNKMWVIGGWDVNDLVNDVWSSTDGINWTQATANAAWSARINHTSVVFDNKMWVIGGFGDRGVRPNDVWSSTDGITWTQATDNAPLSGAWDHTSVVFDNKMWVIGGYATHNALDDVWSSTDGITWTEATAAAGWSARRGHTSVVFGNKMWVIGGRYQNDVWCSTDGIAWTQATANAAWSARQDYASVVFDNKMWVIGGYDGAYQDDVWYGGEEWLAASLSGSTLTATYEANTGASRTGTVTVSGNGLTAMATVTQDGVPTFVDATFYDTDGNIDQIAIQMSEVIDFSTVEAADFTLGGGTVNGVANIAQGGETTVDATDMDAYFTLLVTLSGTATATLSYDPDGGGTSKLADLTGNRLVALDSDITGVDEAHPTVTVNQGSSQDDPTNVFGVVFDAIFSEPVTFGNLDGIIYTESTVGGGIRSSNRREVSPMDGTTYTLTLTSSWPSSGDWVITMGSGVATDVAGNVNRSSTSTDNRVTFNDETSPTVTIEQDIRQPDPTNVGRVVFEVEFNEPVTGFTNSDVNITTGSNVASNMVEVSDISTSTILGITRYSIAVVLFDRSVNPFEMETGGLDVVASIPAGAAEDAAGNFSLASTSTDNTVVYDISRPVVTISRGSSQADPTNMFPVEFDVVFSERVIGFGGGSGVDYSGSTMPEALVGTAEEVAPNDGTTYVLKVFEVTGMSGMGVVTASIPAGVAVDAVGYENRRSTSSATVSYDTTSPTVTIEQGSTQEDPTNVASVVFDIVFSETVTGFEDSDVSYAGSTVSGTLTGTVTGSGTDYTLTVTGMTGDGVVTASIPADVATDETSNGNEISTSVDNTVDYDMTAPTVTIEQGSTQEDPTNVASVVFDVTFSEPVAGFEASDVDLTDSTAPGTLTGAVMTVDPTVVEGTTYGTTYTLTVTGMTGDGEVTASIPAGVATDAAGNGNEISTSVDNTVVYDMTAPTVTIEQGSTQEDPTNVASVVFDVTFSKLVTGFEASDVDLSASTVGGTLAGTVTGSGTTYTLTVTGMTGDGNVVASISADAATDAAGNGNEISTSVDNTVVYDMTAPTVTINQGSSQADPTNVASVVFDVTFSELVTGFEASDVDLTDSTAPGTLTGAVMTVDPTVVEGTTYGTTYTLTVTGMMGTGEVTASILVNAATDAAGNGNEISTSVDNTVVYDMTAPTVTINQGSSQADPTNVASVVFDVTFSKLVTGFEASDVDLAASTVAGTLSGTVTGSGTDYTLTVTGMTGDGEVTASIPAGVATDAAGNGNEISTSTDNTVVYDMTAPTVTIEQGSTQEDPTHVASVVFDVTFSEPVTGFDASDVSYAGSTVGGTLTGTVTGSGTDYTLTVIGMTGDGEVTASIPVDAATDAAGNGNAASTSTDNTVAYDGIAPTVTIEQASGQNDPTNVYPVEFDVTFSKPVMGFVSSDVDLTASTVAGTLTGTVTGSGTDYTLEVTGMTGDGVVEASIPADVAMDATGNGNAASTSADNTVAYDGSAPTVTIEQGSTQEDPTNVASVVFDVTFSEPVAGFAASDVDLAASTVGGTLTGTVTGAGTNYALTVTGMMGTGEVTASIPVNAARDAAGNLSEASTSTDNTVVYDITAPTVTIEQGSSQSDTTNVASVVFDIVFSEPVTGFEASDVDLSASTVGGTLTGTVTGSGTNYTLTVTGMSGTGEVVASMPAGVATDAAGNLSEASTSTDNTVVYDDSAPTVTINQASGQNDPTRGNPVFDVMFSEAVAGFDASDVDLMASTVGGTLTGRVTEVAPTDGTTYTLEVTGMTGDGVVTASIPAGAARDAAGNKALASTRATVGYTDAAPPTVTIEQSSGQGDPTNADPVVFDVVFGEPVAGFDALDVDLTASEEPRALSGTVAVVDPTVAEGTTYGTTYTLEVTGMTRDGEVVASIAAGAARDAVGNFSQASTHTDNRVTYVHLRTTVEGLDLFPSVTWAGITAGEPTTFQITQDNLASDVTVKSLMVNITDGKGTAVLMPPYISENPVFPYNDFTHEFETAGEYTIEITMKTSTGETFDSTPTRKIQILETKPSNGYEESFESFEDGDTLNGWHIERVSLDGKANDLLSSWRRTDTIPGVGHRSGDYAIVTNALQDGVPGTYQPGEISFVYSPSFDFSGFTKPAVSFSRLVMFQSPRDGAIFQASTDDGRTWENVGAYSRFGFSGWHNSESIISAPGIVAPGPLADGVAFDDAGIGWTEDGSEGRNDDRWVEARADLSGYGGINSVRFRFALAADNREKDEDNVGFGFDNVGIFEQRRTVLVEQFSSSLDPNSITLDAMLNTDYSEDDFVVRMNYFTDLANTNGNRDPLNRRNADDPGGRIERYGVGGVPSLALAGNMIDGSKGPFGALIPSDLDEAYARLAHEKLGNPLFTINIDASIDPIDDTSLNVSADFISNTDQLDDPGTELGLHIAILEPEVVIDGETVTNVLRKMLPDAAGQYARGAVANGARLSILPIEWLITHVDDADTLVVVAFIQDINTHQVYQAAVKGVSGGQEAEVLGVEGPAHVTVYPNPGSAQVTVDFGDMAREQKEWMLFDPTGQTVRSGAVARGVATLVIDTQGLSSGMYIFQVRGEGRKAQATKQVVIRR